MSALTRSRLTDWTVVVPVLAVLVLAVTWNRELPGYVIAVVAALLAGAVLAAVHHAEVVAHKVGEPYGSLVLAVAVTVIEVALIVTLMVSGGDKAQALARDTVFAAVMITCNGILGLSLLLGALRRGVAVFNPEGTGGALATVATLATLSLVVPSFTTSRPGPEFSPDQLAFAAVASLALYGLFVVVQTGRHRDYFLPVETVGRPAGATSRAVAPARTVAPVRRAGDPAAEPEGGTAGRAGDATSRAAGDPEGPVDADGDGHADPPSTRAALLSLGLLLVALVAVVGDAKTVSPTIEAGVSAANLPQSFVGVVIALLVLLPETLAAARAARRGRVQISLNLALGSAMASIGLTIPAIAIASIWLDGPLLLGLGGTQLTLLALTVVAGVLTVVPGRATLLQGGVHLVLMAAFVFLAASP
ncbi:calcium:proton antiporter [Micromonospora siamensis]|uniref:Ca2+:H+ antiporter n=1 Tax=Micromonospora siamensis TaxID=299152 RepID=A0A1C5GQS7_9ACTN|nr:ionic transporter y4hA [Micromonospora siamensis]SCG36135.1 Ca2+:H+ antiporter [Micromonospora siamensis]